MSVSLIFSFDAGSTAENLPKNMGTLSPGDQSSVVDLYIRHDGTAKIENARLYILPYSAGVYLGTDTAQDDYDLVIGWGDASPGSTSGHGLYLSMDHAGGFLASSYNNFYTGRGDVLGNAITLDSDSLSTGLGIDGEIPAGGEAHIQLRLDIPVAEPSTGTFYVDLLMAYTSTS